MKLTVVIAVLFICCAAAILYIISLRRQIKSINRQLEARKREQSSQALHIDLVDGELNALSANINDALESEKRLRIRVQEDERQFRELIANVSHDMRTPLTAVKGYLQMLGDTGYTADERDSYDMAVKYVNVMQARVEQFFEYAYYVSRDDKPTLSPLNLTNEVVEIILEFVPLYEKAGKRVIFERELPCMVMAERTMLHRILQNLLSNSLRHSSGDVTVTIRDEGILNVSNQVANPHEIDIDRIFERFYTSDKARTVSSGLGLSIAKLLAKKMNAELTARLDGDSLELSLNFITER